MKHIIFNVIIYSVFVSPSAHGFGIIANIANFCYRYVKHRNTSPWRFEILPLTSYIMGYVTVYTMYIMVSYQAFACSWFWHNCEYSEFLLSIPKLTTFRIFVYILAPVPFCTIDIS